MDLGNGGFCSHINGTNDVYIFTVRYGVLGRCGTKRVLRNSKL